MFEPRQAEHLNFKSVGFGEVLDGYEVVKAIESIGTIDGEPAENAVGLVVGIRKLPKVIVDCGTLDFEEGEKERISTQFDTWRSNKKEKRPRT